MKSSNNFFKAKEYHKLWYRTQLDLKRLIHAEDDLLKEGSFESWEKEYKILGVFYLQYVTAINKLDECYDQLMHPQKRTLVRKLMDACICRFLEVKHRMVLLYMDDINFLDEICLNEKILPQDAEINIPKYFLRENKFIRRQRKHQLQSLMKTLGYSKKNTVGYPMSIERAILIIQKHERTRQALRNYDNLQRNAKLRELEKYPSLIIDDGSLLTMSALTIQKTYRGFRCRKAYNERKTAVMKMIGMIPQEDCENFAQKRNYEIKIFRHQIQRHHDARFHQAIPGDRVRQILRKRRQMHTIFRNRVREWYRRSVLLGKRRSFVFTPEEQPAIITIESELKSPRFKPKPPKVSMTKKKTKKPKPLEEEAEKIKPKESNAELIKRPKLQKQLIWEAQEFKRVWQNKDESDNFHQVHDLQSISKRNYRRMKREVRKVIDDLMLLELQRLQEAVQTYRASRKKAKKKKGGKKKKNTGKKGGNKKKKKKVEVDLTADRTLDSLMEELITNGIIKSYPEVSLSSFIGDTSFNAEKIEIMGKKPSSTLGDIRKLIKEYCIIPLGSSFVHENAPFIKSLMIAGPHGTGKHMLVHAICTELGAFLFDITNENIATNYPDKSSLVMLMHLLNKVSRLLQPSIILVDNAEKTFIKKVAKNDTSDPRRLNKILPKFVKGIKAKDCIMLIGISSCPFDAKQAGMNKVYKKFVYIPKPGYATLSKFWSDTLNKYKALNDKFDWHTMAKLSDGLSISVISKMIEAVVTRERLLTLKYQPLKPKEFFDRLVNETPVYKAEEAAFLKWYSNCPLGKKKKKYLKKLELEEDAKKKKKGKK